MLKENPKSYRPELLDDFDHALLSADALCERGDCDEAPALRRDLLKLYRALRRFSEAKELEVGTLTVNPEVSSADSLLYDICRSAQTEAVRHGIVLNYSSAPDACFLADREMIERVLWNLVQNSMSAIGSDGEITLRAVVENGQCVFTVLDTGAGFGDCDADELVNTAPEISGFGVIRRFLALNGSSVHFDRIENHTSAVFSLPSPELSPYLHSPEPALSVISCIPEAELELSVVKNEDDT